MEKKTFILVFSLVIQTIAVKQIGKNEALKFLGYDCNKPTRLNSEWCMPVKTPENPKGDKTEGTKITVIQKFGSQNVKGIKCLKRVSKFWLYCGTYGHQKFFDLRPFWSRKQFLNPSVLICTHGKRT